MDQIDLAYAKVFFVEKNYDGIRATLHKLDDKVKIFSEFQKDITPAFHKIAEQAKLLSKFNFIIDGILVPYKDGHPLGEEPLIQYLNIIKQGKQLDDKNIKYHIFDAIYFNDNSLQNLRLYERKKVLNTLDFTENIIQVKPLIVRNAEELKKAARVMSELPGSKGLIIKSFNGTYPISGETDKWVVLNENV